MIISPTRLTQHQRVLRGNLGEVLVSEMWFRNTGWFRKCFREIVRHLGLFVWGLSESWRHSRALLLKEIFSLPHLIALESYVKAFQYKVINSILYTNSKLCKIGFRINSACTFCNDEPENLYHFFYQCPHSKTF